MKHPLLSCACTVATILALAFSANVQPAKAQAPAPAADAGGGSENTPSITGTVAEAMNAGQYSYVLIDDGSKKVWAAGPQTTVAVGDKVTVPSGMAMRGFQSKTLGRTFDVVYFVSAIEVAGAKPANIGAASAHGAAKGGLEAGMAAHSGAAAHGVGGPKPAEVDLTNIKKADGGQTVAELYAKKADLVGKDVAVRGRVVKYTAGVMEKNWLHVQDGSGNAPNNDLTVSTSVEAAVGKMVLVRGKLTADKDLGFGYHYDIIIEDGAVTVE